MSKVFRIYTGGSDTYRDWNRSPQFPYDATARTTINDPDGATSRHEITSIPSSFARIDLVKSAFSEVADSGNYDGNTIFHKMVSDTLDVAEIFFNIDKYSDRVRILSWDPQSGLRQLEASGHPGHKCLANAMAKYMKSDAGAYNFDKLRKIYLLDYMLGPNPINIIGGTSPRTLFFSNANDLSYVEGFKFGQDYPFDAYLQPLYKRDFDLVKLFWGLKERFDFDQLFPGTGACFATLFPELDSYLNGTFRLLTPEQQQELRRLPNNYIEKQQNIVFSANGQNDNVEVVGINLKKKMPIDVRLTSDFVLKGDTTQPLVLPVEEGNRYADLMYTTDCWGMNSKAPVVDSEDDPAKRRLPFDNAACPYITIGDLLEPIIIRVPYRLNEAGYFSAGFSNEDYSYLLPLRAGIFTYFTVEELCGTMADGKPMLELHKLAGDSVQCILRVPIKGRGLITYIEYARTYYNNCRPNSNDNRGGIAEMSFTGFIMPQVAFENKEDAIYNVSIVHPSKYNFELSFYSGSGRVYPKCKESRETQDNRITNVKDVNYMIEGKTFDAVCVADNAGLEGMLIPKFTNHINSDSYEFSIDLGTSNTHIEYRKGPTGNSQPFGYEPRESMLCYMFLPKKDENGQYTALSREMPRIEKDYLPEALGNKANDFGFPTRTVLSYSSITDWNRAQEPYMLCNVPFTYDKRLDMAYNNYQCNIKWGSAELPMMEMYVRTLMLMMRNKVLLGNGDLKKTRITWFYPVSMSPNRRTHLKQTWDDAFRKYFNADGETIAMTESEAPIQYYFRKFATATEMVNVDIGGGTTDIAFAGNKVVNHTTSFRFAGNSLFEDAYAELAESNGLVDRYKDEIYKLLPEDLQKVFGSENNSSSANMASFLFGLKGNQLLKQTDPKKVDFNYLLNQDGDFKIVFIIFYTAIIYHIGRTLKARGAKPPRHIAFSGNGSKLLGIISADKRLLESYTKLVLRKVMGLDAYKDLEILGFDHNSDPKTSTAKGGFYPSADDNRDELNQVLRTADDGFVAQGETYAKVTDDYKARVVEQVEQFFHFVLEEMNSEFNFEKNFGANRSSLDVANNVVYRDLDTFLEKGIEQRLEETNPGSTIEETFFFYPIKGVLQNLSAAILSSIQQS